MEKDEPVDNPSEPPFSDPDLGHLIQALPALVAHIGTDFRVRFANNGYQDWFGLDPAAQVGKHLRDVIGQRAFRVLASRFRQALAGERSEYFGKVPYARGGTRFIRGTYIPSHDKANRIDGFYILSVDLSRQHQLENDLANEARRSQTIIESAIDGIITIDETGIIQTANPAVERIFGYPISDLLGQNISILMPSPHKEQHDDYLKRYLETGEARIIGVGREVTGRRKDGSSVDIRLSISAFEMDGQEMFVGFTHDNTERNRARKEARDHLAQLARLDRVKGIGELAANLAHEIRQPLMAIQASAVVASRLGDDPDQKAELTGALDRIAQQSTRANDIIKQLLAFLQKGEPGEREIFDLNSLLSHVLELLSHELALSDIHLKTNWSEPHCLCLVNRIQIEQVLYNLIRNAIESFEPGRGPPSIEVGCRVSEQPGYCEVYVKDNGIGIDEKHLGLLFEPFFTTKAHGMGQGLPICRSLIREHGGELVGDNHPEGGAKFHFTLPLVRTVT